MAAGRDGSHRASPQRRIVNDHFLREAGRHFAEFVLARGFVGGAGDQLTGFRHDPLAVVNLIADNLRDRYSSGFPVFKELIQNADDAGATRSNSR